MQATLEPLAAALSAVIEGVRAQPEAAPEAIPVAAVDHAALRADLERLLPLIASSNLAALTEFAAMRPHLEAVDAAAARQIGGLLDTLDFARADGYLKKIVDTFKSRNAE